MEGINGQFFVSLLIILSGYIAKKANLIQEKDGEAIARIVFNVTLPCLIIATFSSISIEVSLISLIAISLIYGGLITVLGSYVFKKDSRRNRGMFLMMLPGFNVGLFAYPLVEALWGKEGLKYFGMFDIGNSILIFGLAYLTGCYFSDNEDGLDIKGIAIKMAKSAPLVSYAIALMFNFAGVVLPGAILNVAEIVARANMPLSLLLLGIYLDFSLETGYVKNMLKLLFFRYFIGLAAGLMFYFFLPFDAMFKYTLLIGLVLPIAVAVIPFALEFDYDHKFVGTLSNITVMVSFGLVYVIVSLSKLLKIMV